MGGERLAEQMVATATWQTVGESGAEEAAAGAGNEEEAAGVEEAAWHRWTERRG